MSSVDAHVGEIDAALQRGHLVDAIDCLLRLGEDDLAPDRVPQDVFAWMHAVARRLPVAGALDGRRRERILALFARAGEVPKPHLERLWGPPASPLGRAVFPVCLSGRGALRTICVGDLVGPGHAGGPVDGSATAAVHRAREVAIRRTSGHVRDRIARAVWWIEGADTRPNELAVEQDSLGLAALIAFVSHGLARPLRRDDEAYTGRLQGNQLTAVALEDLPIKEGALASYAYLSRLVCGGSPSGGDAAALSSRERLTWVGDIDQAIARAFQEPEPAMRDALNPGGARDGREREIHRQRDDALEAARRGPLPDAALQAARHDETAWPTRDELEHADLPMRRDAMASRMLRCAHTALAGALLQSSERPSRAYHLFGAERTTEAADVLAAHVRALGRPAIGAVLDTLESAEARLQLGWDTVCLAGPSQADDPDHASLLLVDLAWACAHGGPALAPFRKRLPRCASPVDDVLWLQAVFETCLHLLLGAAVALGRAPAGASEAARLSKRPAMGLLAGVAASLAATPPASPALRAWLEAVAPLCKLGRGGEGDAQLVSTLNALHDLGAWGRLVPSGKGRDTAPTTIPQDILLRTLPPLAFAVREAVRRDALALDVHDGALRLGGVLPIPPGVVRLDPTGACHFYRGEIGGAIRWWSLTDASTLNADAPAVPAEDLLFTAAGLSALAALDPTPPAGTSAPTPALASPDAWPQPVARAIAPLTRPKPPSVVERWRAADLALAASLRLVACAAFSHAGSPELAQPSSLPWLTRPNKRRLLERIASTPAEGRQEHAFAHLSRWVTGPSGKARVERAVDALERVEHLAGPVDAHEAALLEAIFRVHDALAPASFRQLGATLVGRRASGDLVLDGFGAKAAALDAGLHPVDVLVGGARVPLWPFVAMAASPRGAPSVWFVARALKLGKKRRLAGARLELATIEPDLELKTCEVDVVETPAGFELHVVDARPGR